MDSVLIWSYSMIILLQLLSLYASFIIYLLSFVQFVPDLRDERLKVNEISSPRLGVLVPYSRTQQMFIRGGCDPRSNPLPFYIPFFTK